MIWRVLKWASVPFSILPRVIFLLGWRMLDLLDGRVGSALRYILIASRLKACGVRVYFAPHVRIGDARKISIGDDVSLQENIHIISAGELIIGNKVSIAHGCSLVTTEHTWDMAEVPIKYNPVIRKRIIISDDVWIGCGVTILAGVTIGSRCVIAAGAVVKKPCEPGCIYGGVPAKLIRRI